MIEVEVEDPAWTAALPEAAATVERAAAAALGTAEGGLCGPLRHGGGVRQSRGPGGVLDLDLDHASGSSRSAVGRCAAASAS